MNRRQWQRLQEGEFERNLTRSSRLQAKYGIDLAHYRKLWEQQGGVCAICQRQERLNRSLSVDHDHSSGRIRGLLCCRCNVLLGYAEDNINILIAAIGYLTNA